MRIGQILLEAELITPKQLSDGLEYGRTKSIFLGRAMKLLRVLDDDDIERAIQAQKLIKLGLSPASAIKALKRAVQDKVTFDQAMQSITITGEFKPNQQVPQFNVELLDDDSPEGLLKNGDKLLLDDHCKQAESYYRHALKALQKSLGEEHLDLTPVFLRLGNTYLALQNFDQARTCYEKSLTIRKKELHDDHPQVAQALESLADLHKAQGEEQEAIQLFLSALDILEKNLPGSLGAYASILRKVAAAAQSSAPKDGRVLPVGEILKAAGILPERDLQQALKMSKQQSLPLGIVLRENCMVGDRELQSALKAQFCIRQGVLTEDLAIDLLSRASRRDISLERLLHEAGVLASDEQKIDIYRQIAADLDLLVAAESSALNTQQELAPVAYRLGSLYEQVGDQGQAEIYYSRALTIWGAGIRGDLTAARTCIQLAKILKTQNRREEIVPLFTKALEHRQHALGAQHDETIETMEDLAEAEIDAYEFKAGLAHAQEAIQHREELGQDGNLLLRPVILLGDAQLNLKDFEGAQATYKRAMTLAQPKDGKPTASLAAVMEKQGDLYERQKINKAAITQYKGALMILEAAGRKQTAAGESLQAKIAKLEAAPA
ncbi:MAG: tetratricopeptide repeat protein [Candidatus Obscuribacterales bacterium]|jgi:tetratricopeptide (TPR) repeat protein|nr:tetratricopeptide repeat protein [Candidatus Obscuribacterales bacterium]